MNKNERIIWIDIARGYAILVIIIAHIGLIPFTEFLQAFQLHIFAIISALTVNKNKNFFTEFKNKTKSWLIPYFPVALFSVLLWNLFLSQTPPYNGIIFPISDQIIALITAQNIIFNGPLWFLPSFFIAYMIFLLASKIKTTKISALKIKILLITILFLTGYFLSLNYPLIIFSIDLSFIFAGLFLLADYFKTSLLDEDQLFSFPKVSIIFIIFILLTILNGPVSFYGRVFNNYLLFLINGILGSLIIFFLAKKTAQIKSLLSNAIAYLGKNTLYLFLLHWFALLIINTLLYTQTNFFTIFNGSVHSINISLPHKYDPFSLFVRISLFIFLLCWAITIPLLIKQIVIKLKFSIK